MTDEQNKEKLALRFVANDPHSTDHAEVVDGYATFLQSAKLDKTAIVEVFDKEKEKTVYMLAALWVNPLDSQENVIPVARLFDEKDTPDRYLLPDLKGGWLSGEQQQEA